MTEKIFYARVCENKASGQKYIYVPKDAEFEKGEYVKVSLAD